MSKVYGVVFKNGSKIYSFIASEKYNVDDEVIVETEKGEQYGRICNITNKEKTSDFKSIVRKATDEDKEIFYKNLKDADSVVNKTKELVKELKLDMSIINAAYNFDRSQLLINFSADDRIDFRELAKKLASIYRTRIELRQIGARDKARQISGIGVCGNTLCCASFLQQIESISMNKAKNQNLSLNPSKINGACGRLLCCLCYEDEEYSRCSKGLFPIGTKLKIKGEDATILSVDVLQRKYRVLIKDEKLDVYHEDIKNGSHK